VPDPVSDPVSDPMPVPGREPVAGDPADAAHGILQLRLKTHKLEELRRFYTEVLEFPLIARTASSITLRAGGTTIEYTTAASGEPFYHVAFNIPENKLAASRRWLAPRCPIVKRPDGSDEYHFPAWNAHASYFLDPAGNILEFIARHNLRNGRDGDFSAGEILHASEIALVVDDVPDVAQAARDRLGVATFAGSASDTFAAMGNDHRLSSSCSAGGPGWEAGREGPRCSPFRRRSTTRREGRSLRPRTASR
jgi:catechol-2,3-dioxygenase